MSVYIHDLVANLTMREKAYFKKVSTNKIEKKKNYLKLYHFIEKNPVYDIEAVNEKFKDTTIGKYLSSEYNYLAEQLLKSLVNFHFNKSEKNKIQKSILFINILMEKGLKNKALKLLKYSKKLAYKNELFSSILNLIDLEEEIIFRQGALGLTKQLKILELERQDLLNKITNLNKLRLLREQIWEFWFQEGYLNEMIEDHPILDNPLLQREENTLSLRAKEHWLYLVGMKAFILQEHDQAIALFKNAIQFLEENKHLFKENKLLVMISNCLYNCALAKDSKSFEITLRKLKSLEGTKKDVYLKYIEHCRSLELYYQIYDIGNSNLMVKEVYAYIQTYQNQLSITQSNYIYSLLARNYIISRDFEKGQDIINQWSKVKIIEYHYIHIKLFTLIIYFELGYHSLLASGIEATYKVLKSRKQYNYKAKHILSFFKKVLKNSKKEKLLLVQLEESLSTNKNILTKEKDYKYFDYLIWIRNRRKFISN